MITNTGREQHLNIIAGEATRFADKFVVGSSNVPLGPDANELDFGWGECLVSDSYIDLDNHQVIFYGTLPAEYSGQILEIGLATMNSEFIQAGRQINLSYYFTQVEGWSYTDYDKVEFDGSDSLMGAEDIVITGAEEGEVLRKALDSDLSLHRSVKMRIIAGQPGSLTFRIYSGEEDYREKELELTPGTNVVRFSFDSMDRIGDFNSSAPLMMQFEVTTPGDYTFDAIVFTGEANSGLVTRSAVSVPKKKMIGNTMELEYAVMLGV